MVCKMSSSKQSRAGCYDAPATFPELLQARRVTWPKRAVRVVAFMRSSTLVGLLPSGPARVMRSRGVFVVLHFCWPLGEVKPHASTQVRAIHATHPPVPRGTETPATCTPGPARRPAPHVRPCQPCTQRDLDGAHSDLHRARSPAKSPAGRTDTSRGRITPPPIDASDVARAKPPHPVPAHRHASNQAAAV